MTTERLHDLAAPTSLTTEVAVALLDAPTHRHGARGQAFVAYSDVVRIVHEIEQRRAATSEDQS